MKKILVGVDGSPRHHAVLATAAELARDTGARIILFRAVSLPTELPHDAYFMPPADVTKMLVAKSEVELEKASRELAAGMVDRIHVAVGVPWQAICAAAKEDDVDLIVVGSHGYSAIDRILGTTAAKIVNHADRSVLIVRASERIVTSP